MNLTEFKNNYNYDYVLEINKLAALEKIVQISTGRCDGAVLFHHVHKFRVSRQISDRFSRLEPTNLSHFVLSHSLLNRFLLRLFSYNSLSPIGNLSSTYSKVSYEFPDSSKFSDYVDFFAKKDKTVFNLFSFMTSPDSSYFLLGNNKPSKFKPTSSIDKMFPYEKITQEIMKKYLK